MGPEATMVCQGDQLCAGLKAGIEGAIHGVQALWDKNLSMDEWSFFLIDAKNSFNNIHRVRIIWTVQHVWPSGARFVFNFYCHWLLLVFRNRNGTAIFLHGRDGVMQGDPLAMIAYRIGILPLIKNLKQAIHEVTQTWYADDARFFGTFTIIERYFYLLTLQGLGRRYYPEPYKSVLIVRPNNLEAGKVFGACHGFKVCTGARYPGSYIGADESKRDLLRERMMTWENNISTIRKTAGKYPQDSYTAVVRTIQSEWIFLQHVTWDTWDAFAGVEKIIRETFLPRLFFGKTKTLSPVMEALSIIPVKKSGLGILNPLTLAQEKYLSSQRGSTELVWSVTGGGAFSNADHLQTLSEERRD